MKFKKFLPDSQLTRDPGLKKLVIAGFLFLALQIGVVFLFFSRLPPSLPLFYSRPWGALQLAKKSTLWLFPFLTTLFFILNLVLAHFLFSTEKILSTVLAVAATAFAFLVLFTEIKIIILFY